MFRTVFSPRPPATWGLCTKIASYSPPHRSASFEGSCRLSRPSSGIFKRFYCVSVARTLYRATHSSPMASPPTAQWFHQAPPPRPRPLKLDHLDQLQLHFRKMPRLVISIVRYVSNPAAAPKYLPSRDHGQIFRTSIPPYLRLFYLVSMLTISFRAKHTSQKVNRLTA